MRATSFEVPTRPSTNGLMSLHDEYARMTPFEIAFPDEERLLRLVEEVIEEASSRSVDASLPGIFLTLGSVGDFVREIQGPDAPEGATLQYGALVFQAVHFIQEGRPLFLLETSATRRLVEGPMVADPNPPSSSGYLQLPQHLFWMSGTHEEAPESMDGFFWVASASGLLHVLPITGMLPDRPGFRALPLPDAPLSAASQWLDADMRGGTADYASTLPGHDLDGLYSVETAGEVLKLLARFFAYLGSIPAGGEDNRATLRGTPPRESPTDGPRPSALPYTRVPLVA